MNVIAVCRGESVMSVSSGCVNIRYTAGRGATLPAYKICSVRPRSHYQLRGHAKKDDKSLEMYKLISCHLGFYWRAVTGYAQTLRGCHVSLTLCSLCDSLNYCNKCFPSGGGLEDCESQSIKATHAKVKAQHQMLGLWLESQRAAIIHSQSLSYLEKCFINDARWVGSLFRLQAHRCLFFCWEHNEILTKALTDWRSCYKESCVGVSCL